MSALDELADAYGILNRFHDLHGNERPVSPETQKALLRGNGVDVSSEAVIWEQLEALRRRNEDRWFPDEVIVESDTACALEFGLGTRWKVVCTEFGEVVAEGQAGDRIELPALHSGIYDLIAATEERSEEILLIVAPARAPSLPDLTRVERLWGVNAALYGMGGDGLGSFADLAAFGAVFAKAGAGFVGVNPLHAFGTMSPEVISPYSPSSRQALNPCHIALDRIPGLDLEALPRGEAKGALDYEGFKVRHGAALEAAFVAFEASDMASGFGAMLEEEDRSAERFALYEAISEVHGADWRDWPEALRDADADALREIGAKLALRVRYHRWLQWVANTQLSGVQDELFSEGMALGLYLDLAVGARRSGAESWVEREVIAQGVSIGAPPDQLSPEGQNWDLAAFAPRLLQAKKYAPFRALIRSAMAHAGVLRVDHVLGLNRSYWIPDDGSPGGYIRQPLAALTAILRIEAERSDVMVIGEDLGLVPDGFRDGMRVQGIYGYSVLQYEKQGDGFRDPRGYDPQILACFGTHDTPTLEGYRTGRDIEWWQELGWISSDEAAAGREARAHDVAAIEALMPRAENLSAAAHGALAAGPAALISVQLDDILGQVEAQNLPGTIDQHPNWRRSYGITPEQLAAHDGLNDMSEWMRCAGRAPLALGEKESNYEH